MKLKQMQVSIVKRERIVQNPPLHSHYFLSSIWANEAGLSMTALYKNKATDCLIAWPAARYFSVKIVFFCL